MNATTQIKKLRNEIKNEGSVYIYNPTTGNSDKVVRVSMTKGVPFYQTARGGTRSLPTHPSITDGNGKAIFI